MKKSEESKYETLKSCVENEKKSKTHKCDKLKNYSTCQHWLGLPRGCFGCNRKYERIQ